MTRPAAVRWPDLGVVRWALIALASGLAAKTAADAASAPVSDPDVWWVAAAGRQMAKTGHVPTENLFSFVEPSHPWIMHEWLLGPLYAAGLSRFGPAFFAALGAGVFVAGLLAILVATVLQSRHVESGLVLACAAVFFFGPGLTTARPPDVALLFPLLLTVVAFGPRFSWRSAVAAVLLQLLWTQVHGSFPLGVVMLGISALERGADQGRRLFAAAASFLVTFVNPYGAGLHRLVLGYLLGGEGMYGEINQHIIEFQGVAQAWSVLSVREVVGGLLAFGAASVALLDPRRRLRAVLCLLLLVATLRQVRHYELAGLLCCTLLVPGVALERGTSLPSYLRLRLLALVVVVGSAVVAGAATLSVWARERSGEDWIQSGSLLPSAIRNVPDGANLHVPLAGAGLAIWYGFPRAIRVFYDPRNDCYSAATFARFRELLDPKAPHARIRQLLDESTTTAAVVARGSAVAAALHEVPGWTAVPAGRLVTFYRSETAPVLRR